MLARLFRNVRRLEQELARSLDLPAINWSWDSNGINVQLYCDEDVAEFRVKLHGARVAWKMSSAFSLTALDENDEASEHILRRVHADIKSAPLVDLRWLLHRFCDARDGYERSCKKRDILMSIERDDKREEVFWKECSQDILAVVMSFLGPFDVGRFARVDQAFETIAERAKKAIIRRGLVNITQLENPKKDVEKLIEAYPTLGFIVSANRGCSLKETKEVISLQPTQVTHIHMDFPHISEEKDLISYIANNCPNLKELNICTSGKENMLYQSDDLSTLATNCQFLETLRLEDYFERSGGQSLIDVFRMPNLRSLSLLSFSGSSSALAALACDGEQNFRLEKLSLKLSNLTDEDCGAISCLFPMLQELNLYGNAKITDKGLGEIMVLNKLKRLGLAEGMELSKRLMWIAQAKAYFPFLVELRVPGSYYEHIHALMAKNRPSVFVNRNVWLFD